MISEEALAKLSYPEAPKIITKTVPGPKGQKMYAEALKYKSPTYMLPPLIWDEGFGATVKDVDGNTFIDITGGVAVLNVGRCHPKVVEAIRTQAGKFMHAGGPMDTRSIELARKIASVMPQGLRDNCITAFAMGGSSAVEMAIKYARAITGRTQILGFEGAYHGVWYGSMALTTNLYFRQGFGPVLPGVFHMPYAYCYRCFAGLKYPACEVACAKYFDYKLNTLGTGLEDVAAVVVEPVQGEGGYLPPPQEFLTIIREACDKKGILFIADEVQAGAGRTGKMWSIEHYGVVPDMVVWAKGMGGDQPMSGVTVRADLGDKLRLNSQPVTFARNAVACATVLANIDILTDKDMDLMGRATIVGEEIKNKLITAAKDSKVIDEVRGKGFMIGVELVKDKETREPVGQDKMSSIVEKARERGIHILPCGRYGSVVRLMPPLTTTRAYFNKAVDIVLDVIKESEADLAK